MRKVTNLFTGADWAMPIVRKRWVPIAGLLDWFAKHTGWRIQFLNHAKHKAWERAVVQ